MCGQVACTTVLHLRYSSHASLVFVVQDALERDASVTKLYVGEFCFVHHHSLQCVV